MKRPGIAKKNAESRKGWIMSEAQKEQLRKRQTGKKASEATKAKLRDLIVKRNKILGASLKGKPRSKDFCDKISKALVGKPKSESTKKRLSLIHTGMRASEETKKKMSDMRKGRPVSEQEKIRMSERMKGKPKSEDHILKLTEVNLRGFWYGNVRYYDYPLYCEKFDDEFRERVRAYFGYVCPECGTPQNGRKLAVHHVNYNKNSCCDPAAPRLFIPLCVENGCHNRTNKNRKQFEKHFTDMIMGYYQGKCYFTQEEMEAYSGVNQG
jgi:hypothetical protein